MVGVAVRVHHRLAGWRSQLRHPRQRALRAQVQDPRPGLHLGRAAGGAGALGQHGHLRSPPARPEHAPPGCTGGPPRHLRRPDQPGAAAPYPLARHHQPGAVAGACLRQRPAPAGQGPEQLLGLQQHRLLRAAPGLPGQRQGQRIQGNGRPPARRRPGADPRRGLQPHRRGQRAGPDAEHARHRQRHLLPADPRQPALLYQRLRHWQHARSQPPLRAADGHRLAALLGHGNARGWLPLRPGDHPRPPSSRLRRAPRFPGGLPPGPDAEQGQADRRALGLRPRRLSGRRFPAGLGGVERQVPRLRAGILAWRRRHAGRAGLSVDRLRRPVRPARSSRLCLGQLRHRPRRLHVA